MISGKEALIALANNEEVEYYDEDLGEWVYMNMSAHFGRKFRIKHQMKEVDKRIFNGITSVKSNRNSGEITVMYHPDVDIVMVHNLIVDVINESNSNSD